MQQDEHEQRAERIETLIQEVNTFSDMRKRKTVEELLQCVLDMYGEGLARILELTMQAEAAGFPLVKSFVHDDLVGSLLLLHDLHPVDIETRITQALEEVRPDLKAHKGNVELLKVEAGVAYLQLSGSCHGCPASTITLKNLIEAAVYKAAPDLDRLEVEGVANGTTRSTNPAGITCGVPVTFVPLQRKKESAQLITPGVAQQKGR